jgi:predicted RNA-binding Zn ribbon-like protein
MIHYWCFNEIDEIMTKTNTEAVSPWKDGFLFLGNQLALDFLNTRPVQNGEPMELLPDFSALLRWFRAAGLLSSREAMHIEREWGQGREARQMLEEARALREGLRKEVLGWEDGGSIHHATVAELNRLMAEHPMRTRLKGNGDEPFPELYFTAQKPGDLFAPLAQSAAMLFTSVDRSRVRKCGQCVLHFLDTSKKGTRRWCSMQLCGNRLKVAAYAQRKRIAQYSD